MPRLKTARRIELEAFWRAHLRAWRDGTLNQREYCERHGLALKRFENWRAKYRHKDMIVPEGLLWRRGGGDRTGASTNRPLKNPPLDAAVRT